MISIIPLRKNYGLFEVIQDISSSKKGDVVGFLGPMVLEKQQQIMWLYWSEFWLCVDRWNRYVRRPHRSQKKIGYLPEIPPVYPNMNVFQYLIFPAMFPHVTQPEAAAERVIATMDLEARQR